MTCAADSADSTAFPLHDFCLCTTSRRKSPLPFTAVRPGGRSCYPAIWVQDFTMIFHGGFLSEREGLNHLRLFLQCQNAEARRPLRNKASIPHDNMRGPGDRPQPAHPQTLAHFHDSIHPSIHPSFLPSIIRWDDSEKRSLIPDLENCACLPACVGAYISVS
jgi:hypothetical protein